MKETLMGKVLASFFGHKFYANVIHRRGLPDYELACFIFTSKAEAEQHRQSLADNLSFAYVETVSFRSKRNLANKKVETIMGRMM